MVEAGVEESTDIISTENVYVFLKFAIFHAQITLVEVISSISTLETLIRKCIEKNDRVVTAGNLGTTLVCTFIITLKFLRDSYYNNQWWACKFGMDLHSVNESEVVVLNVLDWELWWSDDNYEQIYQRVLKRR
ncbi:MAG: hypothetical protein EZS28_044975 [Streblomastix strix]|uniref:Cyclin N-terminal domain-containing protein n=1 Tax=Streblomastix strix TaxID=222440 RepID=A0A5J4TND7_9EUKA|nr:MAG: hypothetical protein EZS28_044975 [Streblomastix strix]